MDALTITGNILAVLPAQSGTSQRTGNPWMTQEYVLQYFVWDGARNPNLFIFRVFGEDRIKQFDIQKGDDVKVYFYPNGHEHDGRFFGENEAHKVEILKRNGQPVAQPAQQEQAQQQQAAAPAPQTQAPQPQNQEGGEKNDDLPF